MGNPSREAWHLLQSQTKPRPRTWLMLSSWGSGVARNASDYRRRISALSRRLDPDVRGV